VIYYNKNKVWAQTITKYVKAKFCIEWAEETIKKLNKPPRDEECYGNREKNHTAKIK
jgi:hypothetical protein